MHTNDTISFLTPRQQTWLEEQQQFVESGLSAREFCRQRRLNISTFYNRRERLAELGANNWVVPHQSSATFIDAGSLKSFAIAQTREPNEPTASVTPTGVELRLELGAGIVLTIKRH